MLFRSDQTQTTTAQTTDAPANEKGSSANSEVSLTSDSETVANSIPAAAGDSLDPAVEDGKDRSPTIDTAKEAEELAPAQAFRTAAAMSSGATSTLPVAVVLDSPVQPEKRKRSMPGGDCEDDSGSKTSASPSVLIPVPTTAGLRETEPPQKRARM